MVYKNNLFNIKQSVIRPNDSCIHQLTAFRHSIIKAFDTNPLLKTHRVFLDLSKVFDRICHDDLPYKLKSNTFDGNFFR